MLVIPDIGYLVLPLITYRYRHDIQTTGYYLSEVSHPEAQELFVGIVANHDFNFLTTRQNSLFGRNSQGSAVSGPIVKVSWAPGARLGFLFLVFSGPPTLK